MKVIIPITARTMKQALHDISKASKHADILELRLDMMKNPDVARLISSAKKPVIVTNRKKSEGGMFNGSERERIEILKEALKARPAFIDIELSTAPKLRKEIINTVRSSVMVRPSTEPVMSEVEWLGVTAYHDKIARTSHTKIILSHHNFKRTPSLKSLKQIAQQMIRGGADILKIVTTSHGPDDTARVMELIRSFSKNKIIAFCMGLNGQSTRITTGMNSGFGTFVSLSEDAQSAPGQIPINTLLAGVIGSHARNSLSPAIHNVGFRALRINGLYLPLEIASDKKAIATMRKLNMRMLSVTTPFKQSIMKHLDRIDPTAQKIGAVNTVINRNGLCTGYNTDGLGMLRALGNVRGKTVALIGAGGAARSIAFHLKRAGGQITIYNRTLSKAQKLARDFKVSAASLQSFKGAEDIVINATTVGMKPNHHKSPVNSKLLRKGIVVTETVYTPLVTKFIRDARRTGCETITGDKMLFFQALLQFKRMTGKNPPAQAMRHALTKHLSS